MARLNKIWRCKAISFARRFKLYKSLVTCILLCGCETWTLLTDSEKKIQAFETKCLRKFLRIYYLEHKTNDWVRSHHMNLLWQLSRDGNLHGSGMSHATTAPPKPSLLALCRVSNAVVGKGNAGWTTSKTEHPCPCRNCSHRPPAEKTGRESLLNRPSCLPDNPICPGTELN